MGLMTGDGPFGGPPKGSEPAGTFNFAVPPPGLALYLEPTPKRIRVQVGGETVGDSRRAMLLHESGLLPRYYLPPEDVRTDLLEPTEHSTHCPKKGDTTYYTVRVGDSVVENAAWVYPEVLDHAPPGLRGLISFEDRKVDRWLEEDEEIRGHPRDPYHRIDTLRSSRRVHVSLGGESLADSTGTIVLFETGLMPRYYFPLDDVRAELVHSDTHTYCPYKGEASYHSIRLGDGTLVEDLAWFYPAPFGEAAAIQGWVCFYTERAELQLD
jgi:uncharacterized protein (DUF427 family)